MALATDDEWWTTDRVCAHLKLSKRALWDLRVHPTKAFPAAVKPGGKINLFRAEEVRAWLAAWRPAKAVEPTPINGDVVELSVQTLEQAPAKETAKPDPAQSPATVSETAKIVRSATMRAQSGKARPVAKDPHQLDLF